MEHESFFAMLYIIYYKIQRFGLETFIWKVVIVSVNGNKAKTKFAPVSAEKR